ncbi:MAG: DUF933 domain-containing protein [Alphaproteobacteria bacterium]
MDVTVIGLPACGKSTLLAALTGQDPARVQVATIKVPDPRVDKLSAKFKPKKTSYVEIHAREAAWPGAGESQRRSEIDRYLDAIKGSSLFIHVLRACQTPTAVEPPDIVRDLDKLDSEMIFADLIICDRLIERDHVQPMEPPRRHAVQKAKEALEAEQPLWTVDFDEQDQAGLSGLNLVTLTPQLLVINIGEDCARESAPRPPDEKLFGRRVVPECLAVAAEVAQLDPEEQKAFAEEMGLGETAAETISREAFRQLDLITFFTMNDEEVRAWAVPQGTTAVKAAGRIHTDIERGFIRAEIVPVDLMLEMGSFKAIREAGKLQVEGKNYVLNDGEIMHVRFNV